MIKVHHLQNGLRVVVESIPFVRSVSFGIWVQNGSRDETEVNNGISHFLEHLYFKGTKTRSAKDIADTMDAVGGQLNAFTSKELTCYMARTLDIHFDVALDVLSDMFFNSSFDEAGIEKERGVILEEINMYEDTPENVAASMLEFNSYKNNPLGMTILGTPETICALNRQDFIDFIGKRYQPSNTVIAIAGNINEDEILAKVTKAFSRFQNKDTIKPITPAIYQPSFTIREKDIEQVHLCMGFPGLPTGSGSDSYALSCVNTVFGGGMSSRLFQKIREEHGLAYSVYSYNASYKDTGMFVIYAGLGPQHISEVLHHITDEIRRMFTQKVTADQLAKTREQLKSSVLLGQESTYNRMNSIGSVMLMMDKIVTPDEVIEKIDAVDLDAFYGVCDRIFRLDEMSLSLVGKDIEGLSKDSVLGSVR